MASEPRRRMTPEELAASKATANLKRRLRLLWGGDSTPEELCEELSLTLDQVERMAAEMGLGERSMDCYLPGREEIVRQCAAFRMGWSDAERESRITGPLRGRMD